MYVAPPMRMGAWSMARVLRQRIEYYYYYLFRRIETLLPDTQQWWEDESGKEEDSATTVTRRSKLQELEKEQQVCENLMV